MNDTAQLGSKKCRRPDKEIKYDIAKITIINIWKKYRSEFLYKWLILSETISYLYIAKSIFHSILRAVWYKVILKGGEFFFSQGRISDGFLTFSTQGSLVIGNLKWWFCLFFSSCCILDGFLKAVFSVQYKVEKLRSSGKLLHRFTCRFSAYYR